MRNMRTLTIVRSRGCEKKMSWFARLMGRSWVSINHMPLREFYFREFRRFGVDHNVYVMKSISDLKYELLYSVNVYRKSVKDKCGYCGTTMHLWDYPQKIILTIYPVRIFKDPPEGGKDLRLVSLEGYVGTLQATPIEFACQRCGNRRHFGPLQWVQPIHSHGHRKYDSLPSGFPGSKL